MIISTYDEKATDKTQYPFVIKKNKKQKKQKNG